MLEDLLTALMLYLATPATSTRILAWVPQSDLVSVLGAENLFFCLLGVVVETMGNRR